MIFKAIYKLTGFDLGPDLVLMMRAQSSCHVIRFPTPSKGLVD
jgi:hypothetical protein